METRLDYVLEWVVTVDPAFGGHNYEEDIRNQDPGPEETQLGSDNEASVDDDLENPAGGDTDTSWDSFNDEDDEEDTAGEDSDAEEHRMMEWLQHQAYSRVVRGAADADDLHEVPDRPRPRMRRRPRADADTVVDWTPNRAVGECLFVEE